MSFSSYSVLLCVNSTEKAEWLSIALDSMLNQTVKPDEIVLVQNGPLADDLDATISHYKKEYSEIFKIVSFPAKIGVGMALQQGVLACSHGFIACMDADGYSVPNRIEEEFKALLENKVDMVGSVVDEFVDSTDNVVAHLTFPEDPEQIYRCAKRKIPMAHSSILIKKRMVLACGNYEDCYLAEDYALFIRLFNICAKGFNIQKPLVYKRVREDYYKQRRGWGYFKAMVGFNKKFFKTKWFGYRDYVARSVMNGVESVMNGTVESRCMRKNLG
jgi:glycosyltransferase involved in cell wall biosynthesis